MGGRCARRPSSAASRTIGNPDYGANDEQEKLFEHNLSGIPFDHCKSGKEGHLPAMVVDMLVKALDWGN